MLHIALQTRLHEASAGFAGSKCDQLVDHASEIQTGSRVKLFKSFSASRATFNTMVLHNAPLCAMPSRQVQLEPCSISHGLRMQHAALSQCVLLKCAWHDLQSQSQCSAVVRPLFHGKQLKVATSKQLEDQLT